MTFLGVTMTRFGWFAIILEAIVIWIKDVYLWKGSLRYREFVDEKTGLAIFILT